MSSPGRPDVEALLPCTAAQAAIAEAADGTDRYVEQTVLRLTGPASPTRLRDAWDRVRRHHQAARTHLHRHNGRWLQVIRSAAHPAGYAAHDLTGIPPGQRPLLAEDIIGRAARHIDLESGPLLRLDLLTEPDETAVLVLTHHHAIADGHTVALLLAALADAYADRPLPPARDLVSASRDLWRAAGPDTASAFAADIADMPPVLPTWPPSAGPARVSGETRAVPVDTAHVRRMTADRNATPAALAQAAFLAGLAHGRAEDRACVSLAVDLRSLVPGAVGTAGLFLSTLPTAARIGPADTGLDVAGRLALRRTPQRAHPAVSLPQVLRAAAASGHAGLPDTLLTVQGSTALPAAPPGLAWERAASRERTEFALSVDAEWGDGLVLRVEHDRERAPREDVDRLLDAVTAVITRPSRPLNDLLGRRHWFRTARRPTTTGGRADLLDRVLDVIRDVTRHQVQPDDDLLKAGYGSLMLMSIVVGLVQHGIPCTVAALLDRPTARAVAAAAVGSPAQALSPAAASVARTPADSGFTPIEQGLLDRTDRAGQGRQPMHEQSVLSFAGALDPETAARAWRRVVAVYPALGRGWGPATPAPGPTLSTSHVAAAPDSARQWLAHQLDRPFRTGAPLLRAALFTDDRRSSLALAFHNALLDGWSFPTVIREWQRAYTALAAGTAPPAPLAEDHRAYRAWLARRTDADGSFWARALADAVFPPSRDASPAGHERAVARRRGALPVLGGIAAAEGSTVNAVAAALAGSALARATGQAPGEPLGIRVSARPPDLPGSLRMVGQFTAEVPVPLLAGPPRSRGEAIRGLAASVEAARDHAHLGGSGIRAAAGCGAGAELYQNLLVVEEYRPVDEWAAREGPEAWTHVGQWRREVSPSARTLYLEPTVDGYDMVLSTATGEDPHALLATVADLAAATLNDPTGRLDAAFALPRPAPAR